MLPSKTSIKSLIALVCCALLALPIGVMARELPQKQGLRAHDGEARYVVVLDIPTVMDRLRDLEGPSLNVRESKGIALQEAALQETELDLFIGEMQALLGRGTNEIFRYNYALSGLALDLSHAEAQKVASMELVSSIRQDETFKLNTYAGPRWIGADRVWTGQGAVDDNRGEGVIIGVIDSGVNWGHPSFRDPGETGTGYDHVNPYGEQLGLCSQANVDCNDKLVGVYDFVTDNPNTDVVEEFNDGADNGTHGAHTASTSGGGTWNVSLSGQLVELTGVAPHATIISYRVCYAGDPDDSQDDACQGSAIIRAIDQAIADGVDVINYSIGGPGNDPWSDQSADGFLEAFAAGIFVATSAGNSGPGPATIGRPANAPWITSVGSSTHGTIFGGLVNTLSGGDTPVPGALLGQTLTEQSLSARPIVHARDFGNALCGTGEAELQSTCDTNTGASNPFEPGTFNGEIVVCDRGTYGRIEKGKNVLLAGAGGFVLANTEAQGDATNADQHCLPAVHLGADDGDLLRDWLASGDEHTAVLNGRQLRDDLRAGDRVSSFSSRGPTPGTAADVLKPNLMAPGDLIFAADSEGNGAIGLGGTSMASPHVAGAGALLKAARPSMTPSQISSVLQLTATDSNAKDESGGVSTPHDTGAGRPVLQDAIRAALYLEEDRDAYILANPARGGDPTTLNLPNLSDASCVQSCSFTREIGSFVDGRTFTISTSGFPAGVVVTASPSSWVSSSASPQTIEFEIDHSGSGLSNAWIYGKVHMNASNTPQSTMPVAVFADVGRLPEVFVLETDQSTGATDITIEELAALNQATYVSGGLVAPTVDRVELRQDSTPDDPFDDLDEVFTRLYEVPEGGLWLQTDSPESVAEDLDIYVGYDFNGDGLPSLDEAICASLTAGDVESCDIFEPEAGNWWILFQSYNDGVPGNPAQEVVLNSTLVVESADSSLSATGPGITETLVDFDLRLAWDNLDALEGETFLGAVGVGASAADPTGLGVVPVRVTRESVGEPQTTALFDGGETRFALAAGDTHDLLFIDVPPATSSLEVTVTGGTDEQTAALDLALFRVDFDAAFDLAPEVPPAPTESSPVAFTNGGGTLTIQGGGGAPAGRWYAAVLNNGSSSAAVTVSAKLGAGATAVDVLGGLWEPTSRPGINQGFEYTPAGPNRALLWYTYEEDGSPVWYLASGAASEGNSWNAKLLRFTNDGATQQATEVGDVAITMLDENDAIFTWNLFGRSGSDRSINLSRGCPELNGDVRSLTGLWYRGSDGLGGASVLADQSAQGQVHYLYDDRGEPRWLLASGPWPASELTMLQFSGFCANCTGPQPTAEEVGVLGIDFADISSGEWNLDYEFLTPARGGATRTDNIVRLSNELACSNSN